MDCVTEFVSARKNNRKGDAGYLEMMRRLRLGNLRKLLRDRNGPTLPDDDAGREYLWELLLPISLGPNADTKMPYAIEVWAPWMDKTEVGELIDRINLTPIYERKPNAIALTGRLNVTYAERERLKLWTIAPCDVDQRTRALLRKQKDRARKRRLRELRGRKLRAEYLANSLSQTRPWIALGISRRTWYRRLGTGVSEVKLTKAVDTLVSLQNKPPVSKKVVVREGREAEVKDRDTVVTVIAPEVNGQTCATTEQIVEIKGTTCLNPDAVIGHNQGPALESPSIVPDHLGAWSSPQLDQLKWDDHWHLVYLRLLKMGEGVISRLAA